jgi:hypothetical protein
VKPTSLRQSLRVAVPGAVVAVVAGLLAAPVPAAASSHGPVAYANVSRAPHLPSGARYAGDTSASQRINGSVALKARDPRGLARSAAAVNNPRSPQFHHYLAKGAFAAAYGPTAQTLQGVENALRSAHLSVTSVAGNHMFVHFRGTVGQAEAAFHTHIANYRMPSGRIATAPTTAVAMPRSVASQVVAVVGLNTIITASTNLERGSKKGVAAPATPALKHYKKAPNPCPRATTAAQEFGGLTDDQIAHAYGVDGLYKAGDVGAGQTIAVFELEPFSKADLATFNRCYFGKPQAAQMADRLSVIKIDGGAGKGHGSGESILDVDDVSAVAPGANIKVYEAPNSTAGSMDEYNQLIQDDTAQQITTSWGFCELDEVNLEPGYINIGNQLAQQAALQGQTIFASSGDAGSDSCAYQSEFPADPTLSTGDPGTQPYVIGVGGTTITDASNPPTEQVWNDGNSGGGAGGGVSSVWSAPSWQVGFLDKSAAAHAVSDGGLTPCPQSANAAMCRENPDVSAQADEFTGGITVFISIYGGWNTFGGTSSSAPLWAAMLADINASSGCAATGGVGFVGPSLYAVAANSHDRKASFNDITAGNNDVYDLFNGAFFAAHPGYDMASGLGTPRVTGPKSKPGLATYLCALAAPTAPARPTITSVSPDTVQAVPVGPVTITGTHLLDARALSIGGYPVPAADWSATSDTHIIVTSPPTAQQAGNGGGGPQDGTGRALVSVTIANGQTTLATPNASLMYVDGTAASPVPGVSGVSAYGGPRAGGNTVTVFGSGFSDTGGDKITGVTVGKRSVPLSDITVVSPTQLTMKVPAFVPGSTVCKAGDDPTNDVCQAQVVVSNANGDSDTTPIAHPYTGVPFQGASGGTPLPDCVTSHTCEIVPSPTEYDYYPVPVIDSVTTTSPGDSPVWVSEQGDTVATIDGKGFDYLAYEYAIVGDPSNPNHLDFGLVNLTPTEIEVVINGHRPSSQPVVKALTVQTIAGLSNPSPISYAGIPKVTGIKPPYVPDQGGGHVTITGKGFQGVAPADGGALVYFYEDLDAETAQLSGYTATSDTSISATTPASNPGAFVVSVCTITLCSSPESFKSFRKSLLDFYEPGDPVVTGVSVSKGPASGGTRVQITGRNLSDAVKVEFGNAVAEATSAPEILTNGSNTEIDAVSPPGTAGSKVHIVVTTVESLAEGHPSKPTKAATFRYTPSVPAAPRHVTAKAHNTTMKVTWQPPASDGGHRITAYRVTASAFRNSRHGKKPQPVVVTTGGKATAATVKGLRGGWAYRVKVQAVNSLGRGLAAGPRRLFFIHQKV